MRLRSLWIDGFRGLNDVRIEFPDSMLDYGSTDLRFFVGRNGSGKSTALEALALIFSHLAAAAHPGFDFELVYELRGAEIRLTTREDSVSASGITVYRRAPARDDFERVPFGSSNAGLLPERVVGYSTGPTSGMAAALFDAVERQEEELQIQEGADAEDVDELDEIDTARRRRDAFLDNPQALFFGAGDSTLPALVALLSTDAPSLVAEEFRHVDLAPEQPLLAFSLQLADRWEELLPLHLHNTFRALVGLSSMLTRAEDPETGSAYLVAAFDVDDALVHEKLPPIARSSLNLLTTLALWSRLGVLQRVRLVMRKRDVPEAITDAGLSDGELFYLGRYALLHIAAETRESLVLLDEPETHFNDNWKVELVESVTQALDHTDTKPGEGHQVVIATHSSLTLTDAEAPLIQLFLRRGGKIEVHPPPTATFGAAPGDLGQLLFGLDAPVGDFAERMLRDALDHGDEAQLESLARAMGPGYLRLAVQSRVANPGSQDDEPKA